MKLKLAIMFTVVLVFFGYKISPISAEPYAAEFEKAMMENLKVGDSRATVINYLNARKVTCSWNRYAQRLQCIRRNIPSGTWADHALVVYVYLDEENRLTSVETRDSFTLL